MSATRRKAKSLKISFREAHEQEEALDLDDPVGRLDRRRVLSLNAYARYGPEVVRAHVGACPTNLRAGTRWWRYIMINQPPLRGGCGTEFLRGYLLRLNRLCHRPVQNKALSILSSLLCAIPHPNSFLSAENPASEFSLL